MSVNKVFLIGHLGADPEVRFTQGGTAIANLRLATNETWTDKGGQKQERTEWHRVVAFAKQAEFVQEYCKKGRQLYVEGSLQTREWTDKDGNKRWTTEIKAFRVEALGSPAGGRAPAAPEEPPPADSFNGPPPQEDVPF